MSCLRERSGEGGAGGREQAGGWREGSWRLAGGRAGRAGRGEEGSRLCHTARPIARETRQAALGLEAGLPGGQWEGAMGQ